MRALVIVCALSLLGGCDTLVREDGDYFQAGTANPGLFEAANRACGTEARDYVAYDVLGAAGSSYDRNRAYNATYRRCMAGRGYRPRPYWKNFLPE
jgi:hypothetical protein